mmetsp:Transcript_16882/g.19153  ORF Transcript_16882/g.19153 Transcript_16882/m.19153 type:complete len:341 (+) Transcript_16882:192-1214(+)
MIPEKLKTADDVYNTEKLYEALELSQSGIAEFITPAVYAGHINCMTWIRPPWSNQIRDGIHNFEVGKHRSSGMLRVSCPEPYFADEGFYVKPGSFVTFESLRLVVGELEQVSETISPIQSPWILDICLDYFSVNNPFLKEYEKRVGKESTNKLRQLFSTKLKWRELEEKRIGNGPGYPEYESDTINQKREKQMFEKCIDSLFTSIEESHNAAKVFKLSDYQSIIDELALFYRDGDSIKTVLIQFIESLILLPKESVKLAQLAGSMADLPEHETDMKKIDKMVESLEAFLKPHCAPKIITIARSSSDEYDYTPVDQVGGILHSVINMIQRLYGDIHVEYNS